MFTYLASKSEWSTWEMMTAESLSNAWRRSRTGDCLGRGRRAGRGYGLFPCTVLAVLLALLTTACGSIPKDYYYTLQIPAAPAPSDSKTNFVLGVEHFRAAEVLRDDRIIYYVSPTQLNYYQHHRWGSDPATLVSEFSATWLESSGVFAQVKMLPVREPVDYTLGGRLTNFEEVDAGGAAKVRVALTLALVRMKDRQTVWSGQGQKETLLQEPGADGVASALNAACAQVLHDLVPGLIAQVEQDFKNQGK
jgi:ABC-type uncharacterized transport system auxiliary subunit